MLNQSVATTQPSMANQVAAAAAAAAQSAAGMPQIITNAQGQIVAIGAPQVSALNGNVTLAAENAAAFQTMPQQALPGTVGITQQLLNGLGQVTEVSA